MALLPARGPERVLLQARALLPARGPGPGSPERLQEQAPERVPVRALPREQARAQGQAQGQRLFRCHRRRRKQPR